jgi:DNA polymerase epsilon subunit 2
MQLWGTFHFRVSNNLKQANIFRERYTLLYQRLMQNDLFTPPVAQGAVQEEYYKITQIESLIGAKGRKCIFGMLTQIKEGKYFIEDLNGHVEVMSILENCRSC